MDHDRGQGEDISRTERMGLRKKNEHITSRDPLRKASHRHLCKLPQRSAHFKPQPFEDLSIVKEYLAEFQLELFFGWSLIPGGSVEKVPGPSDHHPLRLPRRAQPQP
jgi:hypothetical protein